MVGELAAAEHVRPDRSVAVVGYGRLIEAIQPLERLDGVRLVTPEPATRPPISTDGGTTLRTAQADTDCSVEAKSAIANAAVTFLAVDLASVGAIPTRVLAFADQSDSTVMGILALPSDGEPAGRSPHDALERLRSAADATIPIRTGSHAPTIWGIVSAVSSVMATPGLVNLDLADIRAVLDGKPYAIIANGAAPSTAATAVDRTLQSTDSSIDAVDESLLFLVGGPSMTIAESIDAVELLRAEMGGGSILWGTAIDPDKEGVTAHVIGGVPEATWLDADLDAITRLEAGGSCPKCGGQVAGFVFGENQTAACEDCGFVGIAARTGSS